MTRDSSAQIGDVTVDQITLSAIGPDNDMGTFGGSVATILNIGVVSFAG